ncbi:hypothetical protein TVAG_156000 [Trichomonas vaginalis G3]|uniref:Uncharacterized protein n=1 Tax=Trichomonas vaginalis (strain ATCC PRA-98 / G3) TaxID=412133 RepID=A2FPC3_TRIV3|nr:hypothetical protein TVAGG3_0497860 [Trichomonas vaginalis G3]EAX93236.1 hypothetical protein TVAG_156000 [Trichomonas vaginalis G3]KAI5516852.1 hypothetical protein TVAGG3_0497860 [Trichomonas vaginalis G3]|eukprot:XP_001306166.1 hypothetical protein [Trichomonas vaginalis G3]
MEESIICERYDNLLRSVKEALNKMKVDGLAKQLQKHKTSNFYSANRLNEVLNEYINSWREYYIQQLISDIQEAELTKDKIEYKIQRIETKFNFQNREINKENHNLRKKRASIRTKIKSLQERLDEYDDGLNQIVSSGKKKLNYAQESLQMLKNTLMNLDMELNSTKTKFNADFAICMRNYKQVQNEVKRSAMTNTFGQVSINAIDSFEAIQKTNEIKRIQDKSEELSKAITKMVGFINSTSASCNIKEQIDNQYFQNTEKLLTQILKNKTSDYIDSRLRASGSTLNYTNFVSETKKNYTEALLRKEKEVDEIIRNARFRQKKLEEELVAAQKKLLMLQNVDSDDDHIIEELQKTRKDLESTTHVLDQKLSQLAINSTMSPQRSTLH